MCITVAYFTMKVNPCLAKPPLELKAMVELYRFHSKRGHWQLVLHFTCILIIKWLEVLEDWKPCHEFTLIVDSIINLVYTAWWRHQMETFSTLLTLCAGNSPVTVIISAMASQTNAVSIVDSTVCSGAVQTKHQSSSSLAFVRGIHRSPVDFLHKGPVMRKILPFDDVIMGCPNDIFMTDHAEDNPQMSMS